MTFKGVMDEAKPVNMIKANEERKYPTKVETPTVAKPSNHDLVPVPRQEAYIQNPNAARTRTIPRRGGSFFAPAKA